MSFIAAGILTAGGAAVGFFGNKKRQKEAEADQASKQAELDRMKEVYSNLDTSNPFAGMENQFAGMENQFAGLTNEFAGLENTMEDLTVNQQQAQFEAEQFQQSQANIMEGMRGAAGGSGIAATVQALAGQGQLQAQQASASIGQQESANQMAAAQQAGKLQEMEARGAADVERLKAQGAADVDMATRRGQADVDRMIAQGEQHSQQMEMQKQAELMGMAYGDLAAAKELSAQAESQKLDALSGGLSSLGSMFAGSDRKLKQNIKLIGGSPSGLNIYAFEYIDKAFGDGVFQGVVSDEIPQHAVVKHKDGYDMVDYSKIDVEFKKIS